MTPIRKTGLLKTARSIKLLKRLQHNNNELTNRSCLRVGPVLTSLSSFQYLTKMKSERNEEWETYARYSSFAASMFLKETLNAVRTGSVSKVVVIA